MQNLKITYDKSKKLIPSFKHKVNVYNKSALSIICLEYRMATLTEMSNKAQTLDSQIY